MSKKIGDVVLDVQNISLAFGGVKALSDISFNVKEHENRAIIGPNGAGKSSMLNCINGVNSPSSASSSLCSTKNRLTCEPANKLSSLKSALTFSTHSLIN